MKSDFHTSWATYIFIYPPSQHSSPSHEYEFLLYHCFTDSRNASTLCLCRENHHRAGPGLAPLSLCQSQGSWRLKAGFTGFSGCCFNLSSDPCGFPQAHLITALLHIHNDFQVSLFFCNRKQGTEFASTSHKLVPGSLISLLKNTWKLQHIHHGVQIFFRTNSEPCRCLQNAWRRSVFSSILQNHPQKYLEILGIKSLTGG